MSDCNCAYCAWKREQDELKDLRTTLAARDRRIAQYNDALRACFNAMVMQEGRESGELHIGQESARKIWDEAKQLADAALATPPTKDEEGR